MIKNKQKGKSLLNNASWNILTLIVTAAGAFFSMPIIINGIGASNYGLYSLIIMIGGFAALQDFGLGEATLRYVSFYYAQSDLKGINRVVGATLAVYIITITIVFLIIQLFAPQIINLFKLDPTQIDTGIASLRVACLSFFIVTLAQALQKIPEALLRYDISNKANLIFAILRFSSMIVVIKLGYGILGLVWVLVCMGFLRSIAFYYISTKLIPGIKIIPRFKRNGIKEVFSFSIYSFINQLISQIAHYADRIVLGIFFGTSDVAFLSAPKDITTRASGITGAAGQALFPKFSAMKENDKMRDLYVQGLWTLTTLSMMLLIPLAIIFPAFLNVWISPEFSKGSAVFARLFALGFAFNGGVTVYFSLLKGTGRIKWLTKIMSSLTIFSTILTAILVYQLGLVGSGIRTILFSWVSIVICIVVGKKVFPTINLKKTIIEFAIIPILIGVAVFFIGILLVDKLSLNNWGYLIAAYSIFSLLIIILSFVLNYLAFNKNGGAYIMTNSLIKRLTKK